MLTAAHCLFNTSINNFRDIVTMIPGLGTGQPNPKPFGEFDCWSTMTVPGNYRSSGESYDYGIVTFERCARKPSDSVGWMGWWTNPPMNPNQGMAMFGYPATYARQSLPPELAGMVTTNGVYSDSNGLTYYASGLDGSKGQSGSAWFRRDSDGDWVVGEYSEIICPSFLTSGYNQARRINSAVSDFIVRNSPDW
jgi:V8-like Glu-specific endopeptidase